MELMRLLDLNIAGEFLVMAATLMHIKSKMLLPPDETKPEEEELDPREELVRRLLEYKKFKEAAEQFKAMEFSRREVYVRRLNELGKIEEEPKEETFFEASVFDLINAFTKALSNVPKDIFYEVIKDEFTVEGKIHDLLHMLLVKPKMLLRELFESAKSKVEIIATFLAILELVRLKEVIAYQKELFGEIEIHRNTQNIKPTIKAENG
jgi:segregation and condensation protein A